MENFLNEHTLKIIDNKLYNFLNYLFPGIFVMEIFLKKGFFSVVPQTIYEFSIYLVWCFMFSLPYNAFSTFSIVSVMEKRKKIILSDTTIDQVKFSEDFDIMMEESKEENNKLDSMLGFLYVIIYLILTYLIYKLLTHFFIYYSVAKLNINIVIFTNTICILYIIYFIVLKPLTNYIENKMAKNINL